MTTYNTSNLALPDRGFRLGDIRALMEVVQNSNGNSAAYGISAAGTTALNATQLTSVINAVDTVASSTGINLPLTTGRRQTPYQICFVFNNGANTLKVYGFPNSTDTINSTAGSTGISLTAGSNTMFVSAQPGKWETFGSNNNAAFGDISTTSITDSGNLTFTTAAAGVVLKQGANGKTGTFVLNGVTPVTINNTSIAITDSIIISLNTVGGTVGVQPHVATITAATSFTVIGTASDTSTYNYAIISNAA